MLNKRLVIVICILVFVVSALFLWDNMLVFDDMAYTYSENIVYGELEASPAPTTVPDQTKPATPSPAVSPTPTPSVESNTPNALVVKKGHHIHINLDAHMLYVYKDGQLIKSYPCSGGKASTPTPLGTWRIIGKDTWGEGFGGAWMGFNVPCAT